MIEGISFHITGNGFDKTVQTGADGRLSVTDMNAGTYTITELTDDRYEAQESQTIEIISGQTAEVSFDNRLKRGSLEVVKTAEDALVEGVKFHLTGTALNGVSVDAYAVTNENGTAKFEDILISGAQPYTIEEVETADRYVVPEAQTAQGNASLAGAKRYTKLVQKQRTIPQKTILLQ